MKLKDLPVGAIVEYPNFKYLNAIVQFQVVAKEHHTKDSGYPQNAITLQTKDIITAKALDAKEATNSNTDRRKYGNNNYFVSNISQWLTSSATIWYAAQHGADAPPNSTSVVSANPYAAEAGFLSNMPEEFREALLPTTLTTVQPNVDGGGVKEEVRTVFLPSRTEVGLGDEVSGSPEGAKWDFYTDNNSRKKVRTPQAISQATSSGDHWWLRTPNAGNANFVRYVHADGTLNSYYASHGSIGVPPALNLSSDLSVSAKDGVSGVYNVEFNAPPTITLDTPNNQTLYEGSTINIVGTAKDTDVGDVVFVRYTAAGGQERVITTQVSNGQPFAYEKLLRFNKGRLFDGDTPVTDFLVAGTSYTLQTYAQDDKGNRSARASVNFTVVPNREPLLNITGVSTGDNLTKHDAITINGNVNDPDEDDVTVKYKVGSGNEKPVTLVEQDFNISIPLSELKEGENNIAIIATDEYGADTQRLVKYTVNKNKASTAHVEKYATFDVNMKGKESDGLVVFIRRPNDESSYEAEMSISDPGGVEDFSGMDKYTEELQGVMRDRFTGSTEQKGNKVTVQLEVGGKGEVGIVQGVIK